MEDRKMQKSIFELMGGTYTQVGDYLIHNLMLDEREQSPLGKYGRMRRRNLKEHRPVFYTNLLTTGKLDQHLAEIDNACEERMVLLTRQMASQEGMTEVVKAGDQIGWVRRMSSIRNRAEEIILQELVFLN
jgi:hypothetical protein